MAKAKAFNIQAFNKAIVALIMAGVALYNVFVGFPINIDEATLSAIVAVITPVLVYLIPNR
jgi:lipopolysaccharide export LptBFGC system permease protein LptF